MDEQKKDARIILPEKYYHSYFIELISFVRQHSGHLIGPDEGFFLDRFYALSENAQCLFIRFSNRKGPFFRVDKLYYAEINVPDAINELLTTDFITEVLEGEPEILPLFTKSELIEVFNELELPSSVKKEALYDAIITNDDYSSIIKNYQVIKVELQDAVEYIKMLFFGHYKAQMTEFVVRDVGHIQLEDLSGQKFTPWFKSLDEAQTVFTISKYRSLIKKALGVWPASVVHDEIVEIDFGQFNKYASSRKINDKLMQKLGQQLERENEKELALFYYGFAYMPPARERSIRIMMSMGKTEEAEQLARRILDDARNATERLYAVDFLNRPKTKVLRSTSRKIKEDSEIIIIAPDTSQNVEQLALKHFGDQGYRGLHGENYLWRNLFGLTFWDELLDGSYDGIHHPLQRISGDIHSADFFEKRERQLTDKLNTIKTRNNWQKLILRFIEEKKGISHPMVYWHEDITHHMSTLLTYLPPAGTRKVLLEMAKNLKHNSVGFPDLFIWKDDSYMFYEVKSPNDQLSAQQLFWLDFFKEQKINSSILRIKYSTD